MSCSFPKCRRKTLYGELRKHLGEVFQQLAAQKESRIEEGHLMPDHVHMMIAIPPKYAVSQVVGYIKGKSAIHLARVYGETQAQFRGSAFLGAGILRLDRRSRRRGDPGVHPQPGREDDATGSVEPVALTPPAAFRWPKDNRGRVSDPAAALSGSHPKAPGFAGGYLHVGRFGDCLCSTLS